MTATRRRAPGEGTIHQRSDGRWAAALDIGHTPDGRRIRRTYTGTTQAEVLRRLRAAKRAVEDHGTAPSPSRTVAGWLDAWLDIADVRPTTKARYRRVVDTYLRPTIGRQKLDKLTPAHVRDMLTWLAAPKPDGLGLSPATQSGVYRVTRAALSAAVAEGVLNSNPCDRVKSPRTPHAADAVLTPDQATALMRSTWDDWYGPRWGAALLTGARQGELLGLEWSRVDLARGVLDVSWQLQRIPYRHGCGGTCGTTAAKCSSGGLALLAEHEAVPLEGGLVLTRPKTSAGTRLVPICEPLRVYLAKQREQQQTSPHDLVFTRPDGRPIDPSDDNAAWHAALNAAGLPSVKLHAARHTTATLLLRAGVDAHVVSAILGHSTVTVTRAYQHADVSLTAAAMSSMSSLLGELPQK